MQASQGKIVMTHFRNVSGHPRGFREVFCDEGQIDMTAAMQAYRDSGFDGPHMMDHTPVIPGDNDGISRNGRAFATGFIRAVIQAVYADLIVRSEDGPPAYIESNARL